VRNKFAEELKQVILDANSVYAATAIARANSDDFLLDRGTIFSFHFGPAKYQVVSARKI
jgi:hypothetical protein